MKRATLLLTLVLLTLVLLAGGCASPSASPVASPTPSDPAASPTASPSGAPPTGQAGPGTSVTCSLPAEVCDDALRAVEAVHALDAAGMPPLAVAVVDMSECRTVTGAPKGWLPCAAAFPMPSVPPKPGEPRAIGGSDALATVTYRNGLGKAFFYVWWWTFPSGHGPINAVLETHNP